MALPTIVVDCGTLQGAHLQDVDALARLVLKARRAQWQVRLANVGAELRELIDLAGLTEALGVEAGREAEEWEEASGVEEEGELGDPAL